MEGKLKDDLYVFDPAQLFSKSSPTTTFGSQLTNLSGDLAKLMYYASGFYSFSRQFFNCFIFVFCMA